MDFIQRNLINERNNLQIELAKAKALIAELQETYRITPARRALLDKIQSIAMRDAADAMGPDGEDFRASSIKKSDAALSRISRIELMKMKGKPSDKRTHDQHPMHRFFPDDRSPNQLTDRALNADLAAERKREISNRPKKKNKLNEQAEYIFDLENVITTIAESINVSAADLYETYRITPARRDLLNKIEGTAMRDGAKTDAPGDIERRISNMSRIGRIELIKMMGKPEDKRTHAEHPWHWRSYSDDSYFQDGNRSPDQLTDRAIKSDLSAERVREIRNRPNDKTAN